MIAVSSRLSALPGVDVLLDVLSVDERPTFILELYEDGIPCVVFQNAALDALIAYSTEPSAFDEWVTASLTDLLKDEPRRSSYCGRRWSSKQFRDTWRLISCSPDASKPQTPRQINIKSPPGSNLHITAQVLSQTAGNSLYLPTPLTPLTPLSPLNMDKPRKRLADWTLADAATPWFHFVKNFLWDITPFGAITSWSLELRRSTAKIMNSPDPRILVFGDQQAIMYNEAFAAVIGRYHPQCLGLPIADAKSDRLFDILRHMTQSAYENGKGARLTNQELLIERNGSQEQTFWNIFLSPLPGEDGYCDSVVGEFTEMTELVVQDQRRAQGVEIFESISKVETLPELWSRFLGAIEEDTPDVSSISYAMVYTALDKSTHAYPDELPTPCENPLATPPEPPASAFIDQFRLADSVGLPESPLEPVINISAADTSGEPSLADLFREALKTKEIIAVHGKSLPRAMSIEIPDVGPVNSACVLPVSDLNSNPLAFVVLGIHPRRPYTEQTSRFVYYIREAISKHAILITLPEEQQKFQKKYEETTMALSHQLRLSILKAKKKEEKFLRIAKSAPLGMYLYSPKAKTIRVNDAYLKITGTSKESLYKECVSGLPWLQTVSEEFLEIAVKEWKHLMTKKTPSAIEYKIRGPPNDPNPRWVSATSFPDLDENGEVDLIHGWLVDISDRLCKETLLAQRLEDALETKKATEHFLDMVSHEMRNPLSAIFQSTDEILETVNKHLTQPDQPHISAEKLRLVEDAAQTIALCAHHQKGIFDDILTVSKLDSQLLTIMPEKVRPVDVVQRALRMYEQEARRSDIVTSIDIKDTYRELVSEFVMLDPNRLLQVIINLLTNAIKHTRSCKERSIKISVGASIAEPSDDTCQIIFMPTTPKKLSSPLTPGQEQDQFSAAFESSHAGEDLYLHVVVQDSGCGLTEEEMSLLFKRFSQPKTYGQYGGSGLGLFLSKELIELQAGRIGVRSTQDVGTSFAFYIKCRRLIEVSALKAQPINQLPPNSPRLPGHRPRMSRTEAFDAKDLAGIRQLSPVKDLHVLVVEDNLINQRVMAKQLRSQGCTVHVANHGLEALDLLSKTSLSTTSPASDMRLDICLLDIEMPIMDGITCIRKIRIMESEGLLKRRLPVIAVTANARAEQIEAAMEAGMNDVVTKPFRIPELLSQMRALVGDLSLA